MVRTVAPRWRSTIAVLLIVVTAVTTPLAAQLAWFRTSVLDADRFVATAAELRNDPDVQTAVVQASTQAIMTGLDIEGRTRGGLGDLAELAGLPPRTSELLPSLAGPIALAVEEFVANQVTRVVESDQFAQLWERSLRAAHGQLIAVLRADESSLTALEDGWLSLRIGTVVDAARDRLIANGFSIARFIPDSQATLRLAQLSPQTVDAARTAYWWLQNGPLVASSIAVLALLGALLVAHHRPRALRWAGLAILATGLLTAIGVRVGRGALASDLTGALESEAATRVADVLLSGAQTSAWAVAAGGVLIAATGFVLGRRPPTPVELS